jgi:hypothetical protein
VEANTAEGVAIGNLPGAYQVHGMATGGKALSMFPNARIEIRMNRSDDRQPEGSAVGDRFQR